MLVTFFSRQGRINCIGPYSQKNDSNNVNGRNELMMRRSWRGLEEGGER